MDYPIVIFLQAFSFLCACAMLFCCIMATHAMKREKKEAEQELKVFEKELEILDMQQLKKLYKEFELSVDD